MPNKWYILKKRNVQISMALFIAALYFLLRFLWPSQLLVEYGISTDKTDNILGQLTDGTVVEQLFTSSRTFHQIDILFATYSQKLTAGEVTAVLLAPQDGTVLKEEKWSASQILDNEYLHFTVSEPGGEYLLRLYFEGFSPDYAPTLFYAEPETSVNGCIVNGVQQVAPIQFRALQLTPHHSIDYAFLCCLVLLLGLLCGTAHYGKKFFWVRLALALPVGVILALYLTAYRTTDVWSLQTLYRLHNFNTEQMELTNLEVPSEEQMVATVPEYRLDGTVKSLFTMCTIPKADVNVLNLRLYPVETTKYLDYAITVFIEYGTETYETQRFRTVYSGQEYIDLTLSSPQKAHLIRVDTPLYTGGVEDLSFRDDVPVVEFEKIVINSSHAILMQKQRMQQAWAEDIVFVGLFLILVGFWIYFKIDQRLLCWLKCRHITEEKIFLCVSLLMGLFFAFALPLAQAPDEMAHMGMISQGLGYSELTPAMYEYLDAAGVSTVATMAGNQFDPIQYWGSIGMPFSEKLQRDSFHFSIQILRHLPAGIGVQIGLWFQLAPFWVFTLGRLMGLFVYLLAGTLAIRLMPIKKNLFLLFLMLPMVLQQVVSLSYDSFLMSLSVVLISYIMHLKFVRTTVGIKELGIVLAMSGVIAVVKLPYVLLGLLFLLIPAEKMLFKLGPVSIDVTTLKSGRFLRLALICIVIALPISIFILSKAAFGRYLLAYIFNVKDTFRILQQTFSGLWRFYLQSLVGYFGWLDTPTPFWFVWFVLAVFICHAVAAAPNLSGSSQEIKLSTRDRIALLLFFIMGVYLLMPTMLNWTFRLEHLQQSGSVYEISSQLPHVESITGIQGRYFLPFFLFPFLAVSNTRSKPVMPVLLIELSSIIMISAVTIGTILQRYWIGW